MAEEKKGLKIKIPSVNKWMLATLILAILLPISFLLNKPERTGLATLTGDEVSKKVISYINQNLVKGSEAEMVSVEEVSGLYRIITKYRGQEIPVYATMDGKLLILPQGVIDMTKTVERTEQTTEVPKREKADVKLFVMSFCPFGLQAEKALLPVMKLLKDKADISIHFVYYAMHGEKEVYENLRQFCIQKEQKEKFYDYLLCFVQSGDAEKCIGEAGIDASKLRACMDDTDKRYGITENLNNRSTWYNGRFPRFDIDLDLNKKYNVQGSPTLVINDKVVRVTRSPEAFKEAICSGFNTPPEECNEKLSTKQASPG
ncbi:MAG TPA: hypothetical protein ENG45_00005, partial [Candidatus Aenigmarchaeota archaeon]|nr:hypothetical protein [Candidatus Aenigmarchaeota archaeon]